MQGGGVARRRWRLLGWRVAVFPRTGSDALWVTRCSQIASFEKFLVEKIKVANKAGNLGDSIKVSRDKTKLTVTADIPMSKRYLKYLTKK